MYAGYESKRSVDYPNYETVQKETEQEMSKFQTPECHSILDFFHFNL